MDDQTTEVAGGRRLDATAVNRLAQEIDDAAQGTNLVSKFDELPRVPGPEAFGDTESSALPGDNPVESQEVEAQAHVFPPDIHPTTEIGGSAEDQGGLRDEYAGR